MATVLPMGASEISFSSVAVSPIFWPLTERMMSYGSMPAREAGPCRDPMITTPSADGAPSSLGDVRGQRRDLEIADRAAPHLAVALRSSTMCRARLLGTAKPMP